MISVPPGPLAGLRVLDLAGPFGVYGTRMLADTGADVVKLEPPGGDPLRRRPPLYDGVVGLEGSLPFFLMNCNKRGITLDLSTAEGRRLFRQLVARADVVVESYRPGYLDDLGVGYRSFEPGCERLIWVAVTPFGQDGPYAHFRLSELTAQAIGGALYLTGEKAERPVQGGGHVAEKIAGYMTALAAVTALHWRDHGGRGQYVDLSVHEAVVSQMESFTTKIFYSGEIYSREGRLYPRTYPAGLFPCRDGWISLVAGPRHQWEALCKWVGDERLFEERFTELDERMRDRPYLDAILCDWTSRHKKADLFEEGQRRRIPVGISFTPGEVVRDEHLLSREYLSIIQHAALGEQKVPGRPFLAETAPWALRRPAPLLGEHNAEVLGRARYGRRTVAQTAPAERPMTASRPLALAGIRVLDLTWVIAGPVCTRLLADQGAEVIKLESAATMDPIRMSGQWLHGVNTSPDGGATFTHYNRNKLSATLNLKQPRGRELFLRLAAESDVIVNNYSAGAMERLGLGYEVLRQANPRVVVAELSGMGQTGPYRPYVAFGMTLMAMAGAYELTGYPGSTPYMPGYTFTDFASAAMGAFAIISALHFRDRSGEGQYLDLGQYQMGASLFAEEQFEYLVNGVEHNRQGNLDPGALVHGVYRCAGEDEWCAIVARTDQEWDALVRLGVLPGWLHEKRLTQPLYVERSREEIDAVIEDWTLPRDARDVMLLLQRNAVEAARVQNAWHIVRDDEQLASRQWFLEFTHLLGDRVGIDGLPFRMSRTPAASITPGPVYGADNDYVFGELLGLPPEEIAQLRVERVIA